MRQNAAIFHRTGILLLSAITALSLPVADAGQVSIVRSAEAGATEKLAARELRRYLYARTGSLVPVGEAADGRSDCIVVGRKDRDVVRRHAGAALAGKLDALAPQEYLLKTVDRDGRKVLIVAGGDDIGTLYGAYCVAEHLGVRFYMEGDVIPDERIALTVPALDETGSPLFELRGIQPFHDFPEGPDWWDLDMYRAIIAQLPKMRMNFFGLHTYPEGSVGPEPVVWMGRPDDVADDGRVKFSYPARHFSTLSATWGSVAKKTSDYLFGAGMLYDIDAYAQDVQRGFVPWPETPEECNEFFNRFGEKLRVAFTDARRLGVKTCIGTETPLIVPREVTSRLNPAEVSIKVDGGSIVTYPSEIANTELDPVYQSVRYNVDAYRFGLSEGTYTVMLRFCEVAYNRVGARVFGVKLQGKPVIENLDVFARVGKNHALDFSFDGVQVTSGRLDIEFIRGTELPCIAAIEISGPTSIKIDCGATHAYQDYLADDGRPGLERADYLELYRGMFTRIIRTHPLDYYWFWTPENWTWSGASEDEVRRTMEDLHTAIEAAATVKAPFELATCGWVLGPPSNRALFDEQLPESMAVSCINRAVGHEAVEPAFARVQGRGKWAIPWLEDDPAMISPQLWAGRMRKDAYDAKAYGCTGLMGIHWRTRVLGPNVSALAKAAWDQSGWAESVMHTAGADGGRVETFAEQEIDATTDDTLYQTQSTGLRKYCFPVANGKHNLVLHFCELVHSEKGRRVFTIKVQGKPVLEDFDIFAEAGHAKAVTKPFDGVTVTDGWLVIEFAPQVGEPCISAVHDQGPFSGKLYNVGGPAHGSFAADLVPERQYGRYLNAADFYADWALHQFGEGVAGAAGALFARIDNNLPRPSTWIAGPGRVFADGRPWEQIEAEYAFVEEMEALRGQVRGAGHLERFDFWLDSFRYMRANARVNHLLARQDVVLAEIAKLSDAEAKKILARELALPLRVKLVEAVGEVYRHLLATVTNASELGTIANWEQHSLPAVLDKPGEQIAEYLGEPLPPEAVPSRAFAGKPRLIVPMVRTSVLPGEPLTLRIIHLDREPETPVIHWRPMGSDNAWQKVPAKHLARAVYEATLSADIMSHNVEYYIEAGDLRFPATAPRLNQTVIVIPAE